MNAQKANFINALLIIIISAWTYYDDITQPKEMLWLLFSGIVLIAMNNGILYQNRGQKGAALIVTTAILFGFVKWYPDIDSGHFSLSFWMYILLGITSFFSFILLVKELIIKKS